MKHIITILLLIVSTATWAQVEVGDVISDKHKDKIEDLKDPRAKLKKYRKYYSKDSVRQVKDMEQQAVEKMDSIGKVLKSNRKKLKKKISKHSKEGAGLGNNEALPDLDIDQTIGLSEQLSLPEVDAIDIASPSQQMKDKANQAIEENQSLASVKKTREVLETHKEDLSKYTEEVKSIKLDSAQIATYKNNANEELKSTGGLGDNAASVDELKNMKLDSAQVANYKTKGKEKGKAAISKAENKAADQVGMGELKEQQKAVDEVKKTPEDYKKLAEEYQDKGQLKEKAKKASREKAAKFLLANPDKLLVEQKKMGLLKNKFSSVLNSNDLSTAVKLNSLKGRTFRERLIFGGDFQLVEAKPLTVAASPLVGYRFNKRLSAGVAANIRISQEKNNPTTTTTTKKDGSNARGGKAFVQYALVKSFHSIAEYELLYTEVADATLDQKVKKWVPGLFIGVGRKFPIHAKVDASVSILYNLVYDASKSPYSSPFVFRFGFQLSELALLKKK